MHRLALVLLLLTTAACSAAPATAPDVASLATDDATSGPTAAATEPVDMEEAQLAFAECLREHGVDVPDPGPGGGLIIRGGPDDERGLIEEAQEECGHFLDAVRENMPEPDPEQEQAMREQALAFAECMREQGIDFPDPQFEPGGGMQQMLPEGVDMDRLQEAREVCGELFEGEGGPEFGFAGPPPGDEQAETAEGGQ